MTDLPSTAELLLRADRERERSRQRSLGMSSLGGCRRRAGYELAGYEHGSVSGSVQAVLGTAAHEAVDAALRSMRDDGLIPADSLINEEVTFAGITGHPDLYVRPLLRDTKTVGYQVQLEKYRLSGPPRQHRWQVMTYAAALITTGRPVQAVQLDYIARDSGKTWMWTSPFVYGDVADAMAWLANVRETPLDWLARDYAPDSLFCRHCPFREVCWAGHTPGRDPRSVLMSDNTDAARWAEQLEQARAAKKDAEEKEAEAKGALDALRPNDKPGSKAEVAIPDYPKLLRFTVTENRRLDSDQVRMDYARAGAAAPENKTIAVKLDLVAPPMEHE